MARSDIAGQAQDAAPTMKSLRASLQLLMRFAGESRDYGVSELAQLSGLSKSTVSKTLDVLAEHGLLGQDPDTKRYSVGVRAYTLGSRFLMHDRLCGVAYPVMRDLVGRTRHSARLSIIDRDHVLYLLGLEGPLFMDTGWRAGTWLPPQSTTAGRVMLAFMAEADAREMTARHPLRAVTPTTIVDPAVIGQILARARRLGYSSQRNETTPGLGSVSVPLFGVGQKVIGALSLVFPSHIVSGTEDTELAQVLHGAARVVSQRSGCPVYPFGGEEGGPPESARRPAHPPGKRAGR